MKNFIVLVTATCLLLCVSSTGMAQRTPRNNFYGEVMGVAIVGSVQYERIQPFFKNRLVLLGAHIGAGLVRSSSLRGYSMPVGANLCIGANRFYGEIGFDHLKIQGKSYGFLHPGWNDSDTYRYNFWHLGVRYQPRRRGLFIRAFVFPIKATEGDGGFILDLITEKESSDYRDQGIKYQWWPGIDIGYSF
jgi:hypothetical protein